MHDPELFIRLYLDADVDVRLAKNLRSAGYDCISAREIGHHTLDDEEILSFATSQRRTLLTHNTQDFVPIFERWWNAGRSHGGIIVSQHLSLGELQRRVLHLMDTILAEDMRDNIRNLAEFAVRE